MDIHEDKTQTLDLLSESFVSVSGISNFRDLGGYPLSLSGPSPRYIRRNIIYRCGDPSNVSEDGIKKLQSLGVTHMYDLRSKDEIERNKGTGWGGVKEWSGCDRVFAPVFLDADYSPEALAIRYKDYATEGTEGFVRAYTDILEAAPSSYRKILLHLANEPSKPLIIHCTAGKDRTGVICALILSLCGVEDNIVAYEYSLTEKGLAEFREMLVAHLEASLALKGDRKGATNMISAKAENMLATLKMIREKFGDAEQYVKDRCGLTTEEVERIRKNLVAKAAPVHRVTSVSE